MGAACSNSAEEKRDCFLCSFCRWLNKREWPAAIQPRIYEICSPWHVCGASGSAYSYPFRAAYAHADLQLCPESFFLQVRSLGL